MWTLLTLGTKGYGSRLVILSTALQRAALTSSRQLRYEQAKHVDGLQSDMDFAKMLSFSSYGWLTLTIVSEFSEDKNTHS